MIRNVSLNKIGKLSPYAAFRVGMYDDARRMWMHIARTAKVRQQQYSLVDAVRYARDSHRSFMSELKVSK